MARSSSVPPIDAVVLTGERKIDRHRDIVAMFISAGIHALFLIILALWVLPSLTDDGNQVLEVAFGADGPVGFDVVQLSNNFEPPVVDQLETPAAVRDTFVTAELDFSPFEKTTATDESVAVTSIQPAAFSENTMSSSDSVEGAVDRITSELNAKLHQGDLLVVWLLDASNSLVDDRQRVAARLKPFYQALVDRRNPSQHVLRSAVVSYGSAMRERVAPTEFGKRIVAAVESMPVDRSGQEQVFAAVAKCAEHYRSTWKDKQFAIVIWTDESGDDIGSLEDTIAVCRQHNVTISVVGPSSVLGADTGLHSYTDPKSHEIYQLPVQRGPETARPERVELGYWYLTRFRGGRRRGLPSWLGGQDLEGILSGFSPYALTRLSMQTGGSYTIFDNPEDRGPFDPITMKQYAPGYESLAEYEEDIQANPLRQKVMKAVAELKGKKIDAPQTMLFIKKTGQRTFDFMRLFYPPREFQAKLWSSRGRLKASATRSSKVIEAALQHVSKDGDPEIGLEDLYRYETSPRWQAWYDLTRGRLLATSVRLEEYRLTIDAMAEPGTLASTTNHVILVGSSGMRSDDRFRKRADEAERLLRRCLQLHRGTPWEILAQRELDFALGVGIREMSLTPTPGGPAMRQPNLPRF